MCPNIPNIKDILVWKNVSKEAVFGELGVSELLLWYFLWLYLESFANY